MTDSIHTPEQTFRSTGGVKPFSISGRMIRERERLFNMTDEERKWRHQWLKDQQLSPNEPCVPPDYYKERYNPIRRFYRYPLEKLQQIITPIVGEKQALNIRFWTGKTALALFVLYSGVYYFKYNANDWTRRGGWRVVQSRKSVVPGDPGYPQLSQKTKGSDYHVREFDKSPI